MRPLVLETLSKAFPQSHFQLGPLSLELEHGDSVALFGKNGAGKSTLFQMMTGHLRPDQGKIWLEGELMQAASFALKRRIGYLPQSLDLPRWVSAFDLLTYVLKLYEIPKLKEVREETLSRWDCHSYAHKPLAACSYGMQKRVGLALATVHKPQLLILDEPFSGLDLYHIKALEDILEARKGQALTIVSTHVAAYAAKLNDRALTLKDGQMQELPSWGTASFVERIQLMEEQFFPVSNQGAP